MRTHIYIADTLPAYSETFVTTEIAALRRRGDRVLCYSLRLPSSMKDNGLSYVAQPISRAMLLPWLFWGMLLLLRSPVGLGGLGISAVSPRFIYAAAHAARLRKYVSALNVDSERLIVHPHFLSRPTDVALLAFGGHFVRIIATAHAGDSSDVSNRRLRSWRIKNLHGVIAASRFVHSNVADELRDTPCVVIPCGIWFGEIPAHSVSEASRAINIATVARLIESKGYALSLRLIQRLEARGHRIVWNIVGGGQLEPAIRSNYRLGDGSQIILHGAMSHDFAMRTVANSDLFVLTPDTVQPGRGDGLPVALVEAMAIGTLAVSNGIGGIPELVDHLVTGLLVNEEDLDATACEIEALLSDSERYQAIVGRGRDRVYDEFDIEHCVTKMLTFADSLSASVRER